MAKPNMPARLIFNPKQLTQNGDSFALWQLSHTQTVKGVVCNTVQEFTPSLIEKKTRGFAFVPFDIKGNSPSLFLEGEILDTIDLTAKTNPEDYHTNNSTTTIDTAENYITNVAKAVDSVQNDSLKKVVIARNTLWGLPLDFCPLSFFNTLCQRYPEAMVTLVSIKDVGTWIGATPELLLNVTNDNLTTVALAGTQLKNQAQWTEKESEEQLWVVRYIENILAEYQISQVDIAARKLIQNGNLEHLYTQIAFKKEGTKNNNLATYILPRLHPTPAVGGLGKEEAIDFIKANENFDRGYYSGFLGELNNENTHLFVNLRCMQLAKNGLIGYAGAGITKDSIPEKELQETEDKLNNLKSLLN